MLYSGKTGDGYTVGQVEYYHILFIFYIKDNKSGT